MWELEDAGAFSDEGIMPGCHSRDWEYESEVKGIMQEFRDMAFVGQCIKLAREKAGVSAEVLARGLEIPESFIDDIENGEYISRYGEKSVDSSLLSIIPIPVPEPVGDSERDQTKRERTWWQDCSDDSIKEKVADYLCNVFNLCTNKKCDENVPSKVSEFDDEMPF